MLLAALAMVLEQNPLLAAADSGEDSMVDVCARGDHSKAEKRPKKAQDKKSVHLNTFQAADVRTETNRTVEEQIQRDLAVC